MGELSFASWIVLALGAFFIGLSKTGIPGVGILAIIIVAVVLPAKASTGLILPMLIIADVFAVSYYHRHAVWKHLLKLLPYAIAGVVIGYFAMDHVNDQQLRRIIGAVVLTLLIVGYWRDLNRLDQDSVPTAWWFPASLGLLAGITTMMANAAGPIMAIYLLAMRLPKAEFIGTGAWYFFMVNCFKVPFSASLGLITTASLMANLLMTPFIVAGAVAGIVLLKKIPEKHFDMLVRVLAAAGAIKLLF